MVVKLTHLRRVTLNLDKWAKKNSKITEKSINQLSQALQSLQDAEVVVLELGEWGHTNEKL